MELTKEQLVHIRLKRPAVITSVGQEQCCPAELCTVRKHSMSVRTPIVAASHVATEPLKCDSETEELSFWFLKYFYLI